MPALALKTYQRTALDALTLFPRQSAGMAEKTLNGRDFAPQINAVLKR